MPSVRLSLETGEATTGSSNIQRQGTTYANKTIGGDFMQSIFSDYAPPAAPQALQPEPVNPATYFYSSDNYRHDRLRNR